jgi:hypothetical protein
LKIIEGKNIVTGILIYRQTQAATRCMKLESLIITGQPYSGELASNVSTAA